jgi:hypothetical protein
MAKKSGPTWREKAKLKAVLKAKAEAEILQEMADLLMRRRRRRLLTRFADADMLVLHAMLNGGGWDAIQRLGLTGDLLAEMQEAVAAEVVRRKLGGP